MEYEVMYTLKGNRYAEHFKRKSQATAFIKKIIAQGATKIFLDTYDEDNDLIDFIEY